MYFCVLCIFILQQNILRWSVVSVDIKLICGLWCKFLVMEVEIVSGMEIHYVPT
jgi:hypothetical protein